MNIFFALSSYLKWNCEISIGNVITTITLGFAIWQFRKQMKESRSAAKKLQRENWYLNIIVSPHLNKINDSYLDIIEDLEKIQKDLNNIASIKSQKEFRRISAKRKRDIKNKVIESYDHFIALVSSYNKNVATEADKVIDRLQDLCTNFIDKYDDKKLLTTTRKDILENKKQLVLILNQGLNSEYNYK